jgi:hypothetical protein
MTYRLGMAMPDNLLEEIAEQVPRVLPEPVRILVSAAMEFERQPCLGVEPYERCPERRGQANGCNMDDGSHSDGQHCP